MPRKDDKYSMYRDLLEEYQKLNDELNSGMEIIGQGGLLSNDELDACDVVRRQREVLRHRILGDPRYFDTVRFWMVDIRGKANASEEDMKRLMEAFIEKGVSAVDGTGGLATAVNRYLSSRGFRVTDSGGGASSWHVGVHCTDGESRTLCCLMHRHFSAAIQCGALLIERKVWALDFLT